MYWQVDGGTLNLMWNNGTTNKQADIDVSGWNWRGNGPYTITFVARELNGTFIEQKNTSFYIAR
jgi:hypothetical protein